MKCTLHVTWAINERARELEEKEGWVWAKVYSSDSNKELIKAARNAPDAEIITEGKAVCLPCFVEGKL